MMHCGSLTFLVSWWTPLSPPLLIHGEVGEGVVPADVVGSGGSLKKISMQMSLPLWSVEGMWVAMHVDGLLDAPQSPILLLF